MCEKIKLGLTRNRLFEFDNCVIFRGRADKLFSQEDLSRAIKLLCVKEPIVTSRVELADDGEAFVVSGCVSQELAVSGLRAEEICANYKRDGMAFWEKLFEFSLSCDGELVIAAHTVAADAKSLLYIARYIAHFCENKYAYPEEGGVSVISESKELPIEVVSPILDKLAVNLEDKWSKKTSSYGIDDYKKARSAFSSSRSDSGEKFFSFGEALSEKIKGYAQQNNLDASSVVAWAFYESLVEEIGGKEKYNKMYLCSDRRFFFHNHESMSVGPNNGSVTVSLSKKERLKPPEDRVKKFHLDCYKSVTSAFRSFYEDFLFMKLSPCFCDSSYMYLAGAEKSAAAKRLAENYGCACERIAEFFSCNLGQKYWQELDFYCSLQVCEPLKSRSAVNISCVLTDGDIQILFKYNKNKCSDENAENIIEKTLLRLKELLA